MYSETRCQAFREISCHSIWWQAMHSGKQVIMQSDRQAMHVDTSYHAFWQTSCHAFWETSCHAFWQSSIHRQVMCLKQIGMQKDKSSLSTDQHIQKITSPRTMRLGNLVSVGSSLTSCSSTTKCVASSLPIAVCVPPKGSNIKCFWVTKIKYLRTIFKNNNAGFCNIFYKQKGLNWHFRNYLPASYKIFLT